MDERHQPQSIDVAKEVGVTVTYYDDYVAHFDLVSLRQGCPCATCRNLRERGEESWPRPDSPVPLRVERAELHGAWGLKFTWNDGHDTGVFPFELLRRWHEDRKRPPPASKGGINGGPAATHEGQTPVDPPSRTQR